MQRTLVHVVGLMLSMLLGGRLVAVENSELFLGQAAFVLSMKTVRYRVETHVGGNVYQRRFLAAGDSVKMTFLPPDMAGDKLTFPADVCAGKIAHQFLILNGNTFRCTDAQSRKVVELNLHQKASGLLYNLYLQRTPDILAPFWLLGTNPDDPTAEGGVTWLGFHDQAALRSRAAALFITPAVATNDGGYTMSMPLAGKEDARAKRMQDLHDRAVVTWVVDHAFPQVHLISRISIQAQDGREYSRVDYRYQSVHPVGRDMAIPFVRDVSVTHEGEVVNASTILDVVIDGPVDENEWTLDLLQQVDASHGHP